MFEEGETLSRDPDYVFCPAPHRKAILRLFTRHFCQQHLLPERDGKLTKEEIRRQTVYDMYSFCSKARGLREAWGYLWSSWYSPKMWKLWAHSTSSSRISRLHTTMAVENFWRQLKHNYLHNSFKCCRCAIKVIAVLAFLRSLGLCKEGGEMVDHSVICRRIITGYTKDLVNLNRPGLAQMPLPG
ncbi:hypothetical protein BDZ97DRAFT_1301650 [Flammula alnicola]|nr:hypothetical protein BDZ97DRAFT_1301650 [Flammula alnicola]